MASSSLIAGTAAASAVVVASCRSAVTRRSQVTNAALQSFIHPNNGGTSVQHTSRVRKQQQQVRFLSSSSPPPTPLKIDPDNPPDKQPPRHKQPFVTHHIEPGEYDPETGTDPTHRPPWKNRANIMSAEDFANRPRAGFGEAEFESLHDAMEVLGWLTQEERDGIYQNYLDMMLKMENLSENRTTSHEYVMRVIANKYNISAQRVSAIVQLEHNEDQIRKNHPEQKIHYDIQEYVDAKIRDHIKNAYEAYGEEDPMQFVEDPAGVVGAKESRGTVRMEDLYDVSGLMERAVMREKEEMQLDIDGHFYLEDVDDSEREATINRECRMLMEMRKNRGLAPEEGWNDEVPEEEGVEGVEEEKTDLDKLFERPEDFAPLPENNAGIHKTGKRRPRWKFVAKTVNTREFKDKRGKIKEDNTLVEHDGILRVATVEEVNQTAWKDKRNVKEFIHAGVKKAWLERTRGEVGGWGRVEARTVEEPDETSMEGGEDERGQTEEEVVDDGDDGKEEESMKEGGGKKEKDD